MIHIKNTSWFHKRCLLLMILFISANMYGQEIANQGVEADHIKQLTIDEVSFADKLSNGNIVELPFSIAGHSIFEVEYRQMLSDAYLLKRPDVKTYKIVSIQNPLVAGNVMVTDNGIWSSIHSNQGMVTLYPNESGRYTIETGKDQQINGSDKCAHNSLDFELENYIKEFGVSDARIENFNNGEFRREFNLALVCTGEYYVINGNSDGIVLDKMAAAMLGINAIFEKELAVRFFPIDIEVFRDKDTDPFEPVDDVGRTDEASKGVKVAFPGGNYDIGHAFHRSTADDGWGSGGVARLKAVCRDTEQSGGLIKAKGWSGSSNTDGNGFISLASHEFAHMFGATHTFNGDGGFDNSTTCTDAASTTSAYEIGSGTTIMSYQGLCDPDQNLPSGGVADNYFHVHSLFQMISFINEEAFECATAIPLNNTPPSVTPNECGGIIQIPKNTPFFLKGKAEDEDDDNLLYCWEQYNEDGSGTPTLGQIGPVAATSATAPLFRSFPPSSESIRYFPTLSTLAEGASSDPFQVLANRERDLLFQLTVRDQHSEGGGMATEELEVQVQSEGPLNLLSITTITAGESRMITWQTNGTDDLCDKAKLLLSIDGGQTYPFIVATDLDYASESTSFSLSEEFPSTTEARLMLACDDNACYSFFDITNEDIIITSNCMAESSAVCDTEYEVFDQGEPALDLDLSQFDGEIVTSISGTITPTSDLYSLTYWNEAQTACKQTGAVNRGIMKKFTVDESGTYNFFIDLGAGEGSEIFNIHTASNFSVTSPCSSFVTSNATSTDDTSIDWSFSSLLSAQLEACEEYVITFYVNADNHPQQVSIPTITGPGNVVEINDSSNPDFSSTYIAVDEDGNIEAVSPTSDFTALSGGLYDIYAVNYKSGGPTPPENVDPFSWAGTLLSIVQSENCMLLSSNKKQILVEFTCRINSIELGAQTACDPISNTYSQDIIITYESPPITGNLVVNGIATPPTGSPQTLTLTGLISDGFPLGVSAAFSVLESCAMFIPELFTAPENCCEIDFDLGGDRAVCNGEAIILDAGNDGVDYKWFKNGGILENDTVSTYEVTESGNYLVEVINEVGCSKFEVVNIAIFDTPTLSLEDDKSVCEGEIFNLPANTTATNLQWHKDGVELMGETSGTLLITNAGQYHVVGTNNYPLTDGGILGCSVSDTINIEYVSRPIVELGEDQESCDGDPAIILNAGLDGTEYTWARNGIVLPAETLDQISVSESGQYTVIVDKGGGCDAKDTVNITFFALSDIFAGQDINVCVGSTTTINPFIDAVSFEWYLNGSLISDQSEMPEVSEGGEYILIGYNEIGCSISDTVLVNEVMPPMPDLGEDKIGCIGSEVVLGVEGIGNVIWTFNNAPFSMEDTIRVTEPGTYLVTILAANDCNGFDEINVTFEEGPMLSLGNNASFCAGENYTISADTDGDNITWFKDGNEITGEIGFDLVVTDAGEYTAIVAGASGCSVEAAVTISENAIPSVDFADNETICEGETGMLSGPDGADTYQWLFEGAVISDQQVISVTVAGEYTLMVTNEFDCSASDVVEVIVSEAPTLDLASSFAICDGESAIIMVDSDGSSFQWFVNGEELMGQVESTITLNSESMVEVIASNAAGCTTMGSTSVSEATSPSVALGDDISLCPDESFTFNAGMQEAYMWSDGTEESSLTVFSNVTELTTETFSVTVTNSEGCTAEDEVQATLFPLINGDIGQSATGVCNGEPVQLTATGGTNYIWIDESGTLLNIDGPNATAFPSESTTYQVIIGDDCPMNEDIEIVVIDVFTAGDDIDAGEDDCAVNGKTVDLNAMGGVSYLWVDDPTIDIGANTANPTVSPTEETVYFVDITDENGCVFRDSVTICILDDPLEFFELISIITPNGDGDNDDLTFTGLESFPENKITIYNRWGYPVFEQRGYQSGGELWNGENGGDVLPADTYYYVLNFNGETYKSHITIMR
ncbi:MAG: gliding motility-associated-like protein [Saprospiraceae bacterium]|jgi:gliding motility-associated-like protein